MLLSDISVKRPVFASVISLLLLVFGLVAFDRLPLREYPDIDPPVVSIDTTRAPSTAGATWDRARRASGGKRRSARARIKTARVR